MAVVVHQVESGQRGGLQSRNLPDSHSPCANSLQVDGEEPQSSLQRDA